MEHDPSLYATPEDWSRHSGSWYLKLINTIDEGFCVVDPVLDEAGRLTGLRFLENNPALVRLTGLHKGALLNLAETSASVREQITPVIESIIRTRQPARVDMYSPRASRWFHVGIYPIEGPENRELALVLTDITASKRLEDDLVQKELLLRTVIQSASDILFIKDRNSRVVFVNEAYGKLFGIDITSVIGKTDYEMYKDPQEAARIIANDRRVMQSGESQTFEEVVHTADNAYYFQFQKSPWRNEHGEIIGIVGSGMDISERKQMELRLRSQAEDLAQADRNKNHFLNMLSHELRNPLAAIVMSLELLDHIAGQDENVIRAIRVLKRQTTHLTHLVDDLLDVTRITTNKITLKPEPVELVSLVQRLLADNAGLFAEKGIALEAECADPPIRLLADPVRLTQAIGNLIHNAFKYSSRGDRVTVRLHQDPDSAQITIQVADTGTGIDSELLPHLFEPFSQADRTLARSQGGLGLGLSIVKGMVELHGGSVEAASEGTGKGATFTIRLPGEKTADTALSEP